MGEADTRMSDASEHGFLRVYFVRHGEARHNASRDGWQERDPGLTRLGEEQAAKLRAHPALVSLKKPLFVVVSPLRRALQTATIAFGSCSMLANSDLQECTTNPCDMGTPQEELQKDFPDVDFTGLDSAWVEKEAPKHDDPNVRVNRFMTWCRGVTAETIIVVTHGLVCSSILGVSLAHADVIGASLDRSTSSWVPLEHQVPLEKTLRDTVVYGTVCGVQLLLGGLSELDWVGTTRFSGWSLLHHAVAAANAEVVDLLLEKAADPDMPSNCGWTTREWAKWYSSENGRDDIVSLLETRPRRSS